MRNLTAVTRSLLLSAALCTAICPLETPAARTATRPPFPVNDARSAGRTAGAAITADVLLVTTTLLPETTDLTTAVGEYRTVLLQTEGLIAEYVKVDSDQCLARFGIKATNPYSWIEVQDVIEHISGLTGARYFLLLGDQTVVPRPVVDTATEAAEISPSPQITIISDAWYVDFDGDRIVDDGYAISRMSSLGASCEAVTAALENASELHLAGGYTLDHEVRFTSTDYTTPPWGVCGPCGDKSRFFDLVSSSDYLMFAGHGDPYGFYNNSYQPIFKVQYIDSLDLLTHHPVIIGYFSCNTGLLYPGVSTLGYEFSRTGPAAFVARTSTLGVPVHVAENFPLAIMEGERIGDALFRTMRETVLIYGGSFKGAAGHLVLYGDPTLRRRLPPPWNFAGTYATASDELTLRWRASSAVDLVHYDVHRGMGYDFDPSDANCIRRTSDTLIVLTGVPPEEPWHFKIAAVNSCGNKSGYVLLAPVDITVPTFLSGYNASWREDAVEISWSLCSDATDLEFEIWRQDGPDGRYELLGRNPSFDGRVFMYRDSDTRPEREYRYRIEVLDSQTVLTSFEVRFETPARRTTLRQNWPNPFNPVTTIRYSLADAGPVTLRIYDAAGHLVRTLVDATQTPRAGGFELAWDGKDDAGREVSSGVYFCRLAAGAPAVTIKMVLLR